MTKFIIILISFSACTRLPEDWTGVKTETEFPVDTGTTITVSCQEGYINTGSSVVTCNTYLYQDFGYKKKPKCLLGMFVIYYSRTKLITDLPRRRLSRFWKYTKEKLDVI